MTVISNDPSWWPTINSNIIVSYWTVAAGVMVVYDWILTLGQEIELIWRQRWSLMTVLYLVIRYIGIPYSVVNVLGCLPLVSLTDAVSNLMNRAQNGTNGVIYAMLGVIMIARLYAMYLGSRRMLIFLVVIFLAVTIACAVIGTIATRDSVAEKLILSGTYMCDNEFEGGDQLAYLMFWTVYAVWEILALCLSAWIAVKHFRDMRRLRRPIGSTTGDCFRVLIRSHVLYFASFVWVSCLEVAISSAGQGLMNTQSMGIQILVDASQISQSMQMFVMGPRLILSVREYHATLVANSDAETNMNSIVFQERVLIPTSSTV
ncbi:uncharacterized protein F5147DRAFT_833557 [Suillus discolor]|uniref:DUF6533 domain-containing protein n=1 Tax=Suillus discolor TaxID=1912936 RepID=A0A9P7FIH2_9AGAM|nr:uncharacterized protein F5147DRAFT_833557 [Suillus discolor]KAG2117288.1 hypothetical protein F5147DRAFT_833557 [Suillus discolor]